MSRWEWATIDLRLEALSRDHKAGDTSARHEAVRLCVRHAYPLPDWVAYHVDLDAAVALGQAAYIKQRGQHRPETRRRDIQDKRLIAAALLACDRAGLHGEAKRERASELLASMNLYRSPETLRSFKSKYEPTTGCYEPFRIALGLTEDVYGFMRDDER